MFNGSFLRAVCAYFAKVSVSAFLKASIGMLGSLQGRDPLERALRHPLDVPFQSVPKSPFIAVFCFCLFVSTTEVSVVSAEWQSCNTWHGWVLVYAVCATHCFCGQQVWHWFQSTRRSCKKFGGHWEVTSLEHVQVSCLSEFARDLEVCTATWRINRSQ